MNNHARTLLMTLLLVSLTGCAGSAAKKNAAPPPTENDDVVILSLPTKGATDGVTQAVGLKRDTLAKKDIQQVLFGVCRDFDGFSPDLNLSLSDADQDLNAIPSYRYQAPTKKYAPLLADVQKGRFYPLDKNWCKQIRRDKKKGL